MRKLIIIAVASSTFGGLIAALATAATQSQASPSAIAAAVQRVQDQKAESTLRTISNRLSTTNADLGGLKTALGNDLNADLGAVVDDLGKDSTGALHGVAQDLEQICDNTADSEQVLGCYVAP